MKAKPFLFGFFIGGVAAGISMLLSTPSPGKELRIELKNCKDEWVHRLTDLKSNLAEIKKATNILSEESKSIIITFMKDIKNLINQWKSEIKPHQHKIKLEMIEIEKAINDLEASLSN
ncbi:YtxH domain-containing protein [Bacillus aquiflavi]|uniref:YtxH domain-containing protein n=1 Tax=Bacillus aquiflavi TaxID=2672567 RepID=A0A6B3VUP8_9BACI|nr:YtxH domain-containing protein [Bacillus aquiflavi]MBA4535671.1 YtxH domain-containing protein [Bacillus aquiflavi]NEY80047.1 YtxH domain-containing protein [Bacillus aquiflavi]UAC48978.1 YtxH domain-containing protein [Bacillus aquiflavi]